MPSFAVTGASRGIGLEFVRQLSENPDNAVFAIVRNAKTAGNLTQLGKHNVHVLQADVTDYQALKAAAVEVCRLTGGTLDVLINNAALFDDERGALTLDDYPEGREDLIENDLKQSFDVNVIGVVHTTNAFLPLLRAGATKKVITLSTGFADHEFTHATGLPNAAPYSISKAAVNMVVTKYAVRFKPEGFVFLALSPGLVNTAETTPVPEEVERYQAMIRAFQKVKPELREAISPEVSVRLQLDVINRSTVQDTGAFISHYGNKQWL